MFHDRNTPQKKNKQKVNISRLVVRPSGGGETGYRYATLYISFVHPSLAMTTHPSASNSFCTVYSLWTSRPVLSAGTAGTEQERCVASKIEIQTDLWQPPNQTVIRLSTTSHCSREEWRTGQTRSYPVELRSAYHNCRWNPQIKFVPPFVNRAMFTHQLHRNRL